MSTELSLQEVKKEWHGTLMSYLIGFFLSLLFTGFSFSLVLTQLFTREMMIYAIIASALLQAVVQVRFFLHVGQEPKPRWESQFFYSMVIVLLIIAIGTLWIMSDLNQRVMLNLEK